MMIYIESLCNQDEKTLQFITAFGTLGMCFLSYLNIRFIKKEYNYKSRMQATKNLLYSIIEFEREFILSELQARVSILKTFIILFCLKDSGKSNHGIISRNMCLDDRFADTNDKETDNLLAEIFYEWCRDSDEPFKGYERTLELIKKFFGKQIEEQCIILNGRKLIGLQYLLQGILFGHCLTKGISDCLDKDKKEDFLKVHEWNIQLFGMFVCNKREKLKREYLERVCSLFAEHKFYFPLYDALSKEASKMAKDKLERIRCFKKNPKDWRDYFFYHCLSNWRAHAYGEKMGDFIKFVDSDYSRNAPLKHRYDRICEIFAFDIKDSSASNLDDVFQATKVYYLPQKIFFRRWFLKRQTKKLLKYNKIKPDGIDIVFDDPFSMCVFGKEWSLKYKIKISDENARLKYQPKKGSNRKKNETN